MDFELDATDHQRAITALQGRFISDDGQTELSVCVIDAPEGTPSYVTDCSLSADPEEKLDCGHRPSAMPIHMFVEATGTELGGTVQDRAALDSSIIYGHGQENFQIEVITQMLGAHQQRFVHVKTATGAEHYVDVCDANNVCERLQYQEAAHCP